jgi:hypothetical protein
MEARVVCLAARVVMIGKDEKRVRGEDGWRAGELAGVSWWRGGVVRLRLMLQISV